MIIYNPNNELGRSVYKVMSRVSEPSTVLLVFKHGLGDFINFLPLYDQLIKKFPEHTFNIGAQPFRGFEKLHPMAVALWSERLEDYDREFDFVFVLHYPDATSYTHPKPLLCNQHEIGLPLFNYYPPKLSHLWPEDEDTTKGIKAATGRIGISFFGHTGNRQKAPTGNTAKRIWLEIAGLGLEPFEVHLRPQFINDSIEGTDDFPIAKKENSIRFERPDLDLMVKTILGCDFFVGIDAGPLYLAVALLGPEKCLGLQKVKVIENYLPINLDTVNIERYFSGSVSEWLKEKHLEQN
jgi:hypothetical protein